MADNEDVEEDARPSDSNVRHKERAQLVGVVTEWRIHGHLEMDVTVD